MIFIAVITYNLVLWWQTITVAMTAYTLAKQAYLYSYVWESISYMHAD